MSDPSPLTAGGFAPPPIYPLDPALEDATPDDTGLDAPGPDAFEAGDNQHLLDFLQSRAMAPSFNAAARLDAFVAAQGFDPGPPSDDATQAAAQPIGGIVVRYRGPATGDVGQASPPSSTPLPTTAERASDTAPSSSAQPPPLPDTGPHDPPPPTASAPVLPSGPDYAPDDRDTVPLGLRLQRFGESLAQRVHNVLHHTNWPLLAQGAGHSLGGALLFGAGGATAAGGALLTPEGGIGLPAVVEGVAVAGAGIHYISQGADEIQQATKHVGEEDATQTAEAAGPAGPKSPPPAEPIPAGTTPEALPQSAAAEPELSAETVPPTAPGEGSAPASGTLTPGFGAAAPEPAWKSNPYLANEAPQAGVRDTGIVRAKRLEVELVRKARPGTLNWTQPEIEEIIRTGKLPKGIVGHHINDVARYPEWAGDPRNIQFLRGQRENLEAHGGNFQNSTTGRLIDRASMIGQAMRGQ